MKAIDILVEDPFGPDVQRDSGLIIPKQVQDQIDAEEEAARNKAAKEKTARRSSREKDIFKKQRSIAKPTTTKIRVLFGDDFKSEMNNAEFRKLLRAKRADYKQYVKPLKNIRRFQNLIRVFGVLGVSWMQFDEIWEEYTVVKQLYNENPPQITKEKHDYMMEVLDYQMVKVAIPAVVSACVGAILRPKGKFFVQTLRKLKAVLTGAAIATAPIGGWIPLVIEMAVMFGVEYVITSNWFEGAIRKFFQALIAEYMLGYSSEDIEQIENSLILQVKEEKRQAAAAEVGKVPDEKSDKEKFLDLMKKVDPAFGGT